MNIYRSSNNLYRSITNIQKSTSNNIQKSSSNNMYKEYISSADMNIKGLESFQEEIEIKESKKEQNTKERVLGTPDYIAPEILLENRVDNKTLDWWSVGIILFELLVGIPPFNDDTVEQIFDNIKENKLPWD